MLYLLLPTLYFLLTCSFSFPPRRRRRKLVDMPASAPTAPERPSRPLLSLVVPVHNEESCVPPFLDAVRRVIDGLNAEWEVVFVNDGSTDGTLPLLLDLCAREPRIRVANLSRNFGKEAALTAGVDLAAGDCVVPMDADLQDPPELIADFLAQWRAGYDVIVGVRTDRHSDSWAKRAAAATFYRVFNHLSPLHIPENAGDFRLIDRRVVRAIQQLPERNRFMKGLFAWVGYPTTTVPYARPPRQSGTTKWGGWKLWNFALDGLAGFSSVPLRMWTYLGAIIALLALAYASFIVILALFSAIDVPGYASLITAILFMGGIQLLCLGIIGEYLARLFTEVKARPVYLLEGVYRGGRRES